MIAATSFGDYLTALGGRGATPGGGAAAGVTGAQAAALLSMVCNLTASDDSTATKTLEDINRRAQDSQSRFSELVDEDIKAFEQVMRAYKLKGNDREKTLDAALIEAANAPLLMMEEASGLSDDARLLVTLGNRNLITDVGIAAILLKATIEAAELNVIINLKAMSTATARSGIETRTSAARSCLKELDATIKATHDLLAN